MAHEQEQEADIMETRDDSWVKVQVKTFTKWANSQLKKGGKGTIQIALPDGLIEEVGTGIELGALLECLYPDIEKKKYNKKGKMRIHLLENCNKVVEHAAEAGVPVKGTASEHFVDKDKKMILGFIWVVILHYQVSGISVEDLSAKDGLLLWCKKKTKGYKDSASGEPVKCDNFTTSWQDGMTLAALIHKHRPDLIDFDSMHPSDARNNLQTCFDVAEEHLGIPKLLDVEDLVDVAKPDERSVVTYISEFFHRFAGSDQMEHAGRRVQNFINFMKSISDMQHDYEVRAGAVSDWIASSESSLANRNSVDSYPEAKEQLANFNSYKTGPKRQWLGKKNELGYLFISIQNKLKSNGRPVYVPPAGLSPPEIDTKWVSLGEAERERYKFCVQNLHDVKEKLRLDFTEKANALQNFVDDLNTRAVATEGDIDTQIAAADKILAEVSKGEQMLGEVKSLDEQMNAANIEENIHCAHTVEDLDFALGQLAARARETRASLENQKMTAGMKTSCPPELLQEFKETFAFFDKDKSNTLQKHEFKGGLAGLGVNKTDDEINVLFPQITGGAELMSFEQFVNYMVSTVEDKDTADQVRESFEIIAGGKKEITENDMKMAGLEAEQIEFLKSVLADNGNGTYSYDAYVASSFGA